MLMAERYGHGNLGCSAKAQDRVRAQKRPSNRCNRVYNSFTVLPLLRRQDAAPPLRRGYRILETLPAISARAKSENPDVLAAMSNALAVDGNQPASPFGTAQLASAHIVESLPEAEPLWRRLQSRGAVATPYQNFDFVAAWQSEVGARQGMAPFIVAACDADGQPRCLLPFGLQQVGPLRVVTFLGGKHSNFNMPLWDRTTAAAATASDLEIILRCIAASPRRPDVLTLFQQPRTWDGVDNPFLQWPHRSANIASARLVIDSTGPGAGERAISGSTRSRLRGKERKLQKLPGYRYVHASQSTDVDRMLDRFFQLKIAHMAAQGLPDLFADPDVQRFLRQSCHAGLSEGRPVIELHGLECDAELLALFGVLSDGRCLSVMVNTYTTSDHGRHSPGLVLVMNLIQECARRGITSFDLGVGESQYKSWFCKEPIALFETLLPLTPIGRLATVFFDTTRALKHQIKTTPALLAAYRSVRRTLSGAAGKA
jgi:CelD/BcsL family acetyltransferase involved in cellulose biosynthesis